MIRLILKKHIFLHFFTFFIFTTILSANDGNIYISSDVEGANILKKEVQDIKTYHVFTHGKPGYLQIEGDWKTGLELAEWLEDKSEGYIKVNIYGCEFGKGEAGMQMVSYLKTQLGKNVSASDDITGVDGDWELEVGDKKSVRVNDYNYNLQSCGGVVGGTLPTDDFDGDGVCNDVDLDDDNDGILDELETVEVLGVITSGEETNSIAGAYSNTSGSNIDFTATSNPFVLDSRPSTTGLQIVFDQNEGLGIGINDNQDVELIIQDPVNYILNEFRIGSGAPGNEAGANNSDKDIELIWSSSAKATLYDPLGEITNYSDGDEITSGTTIHLNPVSAEVTSIKDSKWYLAIDMSGVSYPFTVNFNSSKAEGAVRFEGLAFNLSGYTDTDGDGMPDYLDIDSDNDGCPDALESSGGYLYEDLAVDGSLKGSVDVVSTSSSYGVPVKAGAGDSIGTSTDVTQQSDECDRCSSTSTLFTDWDGDGIGDSCDLDDDNDGITDCAESIVEYSEADLFGAEFYTAITESLPANTNNGIGVTGLIDGSTTVSTGGFGEWAPSYIAGTNDFDVPLEFEVTLKNKINLVTDFVFRNDVGSPTDYVEDFDVILTENGIEYTESFTATPVTARGGLKEYFPLSRVYKDVSKLKFRIKSGRAQNAFIHLYEIGYKGSICVPQDTDGDGVPDHKDLDSDNDGCPDALEGDGSFEYGALDSLNSLGDTVEKTDGTKLGVPTEAGSGQAIGSSQDVDTQSDECDACNENSSLFKDTDGDTIGDECDLDDDNDGILDSSECQVISVDWDSVDPDTNAIGDATITATYDGDSFITSLVHDGNYRDPTLASFSWDTYGGFGGVSKEGRVFSSSNGGGEFLNITDANNATYTITFASALTEEMYIHFNDINKSKITLNDATISSLVNGIGREGSEYLKSTGASGGFSAVIPVGSTSISYTVSGETDNYFVGITGGCSDTDGDGTPDYQDLDSDNDGCPDALEGDGDFEYGDLDTDTSLGDTVEKTDATKLGVPTVAGAGQEIGSSQDVDTQSDECDSCNSNSTLFTDFDGDTIGDDCDLDDDNDGILDRVECTIGGQDFNTWDLTQGDWTPYGDGTSMYNAIDGSEDSKIQNTISGLAGSEYVNIEVEVGGNNTGNDPNTPSTADLSFKVDGVEYVLFKNTDAVATAYPIPGEIVLSSGAGITPASFEVKSGTTSYKIRIPWDSTKDSGVFEFSLTAAGDDFTIGNMVIEQAGLSSCDTDGDGTPDYQDLDSDNDGCPDALEGDGDFEYGDLDTENSLGDTVEKTDATKLGVPTEAGSGQTIGSSQDVDTQSSECDACNENSSLFKDTDGDTIGDECDLDDDNDGILDSSECQVISVDWDSVDPDTNAIGDATITATYDGDSFITSLVHDGNYRDPTLASFSWDTYGGFGGVSKEGRVFSSSNGGGEFLNITDANNATYTITFASALTEEMYIHFNDINKSKITLNDATISSLVNGIGREGSEYLKSTGASGGFSAVIPVGSTSISYTVSGETDNYFVGITGGCSDTDGDGTPDYHDLDSDNDGCPDALEGDGDFEYGDLDTENSLGDTVEKTDATKLGVPTAAGAGQAIGSSQDVDTQSDECDACNENSSLFKDTDGDKIGDECDLDDDNDGILDSSECQVISVDWDSVDPDTNAIGDATITATYDGDSFITSLVHDGNYRDPTLASFSWDTYGGFGGVSKEGRVFSSSNGGGEFLNITDANNATYTITFASALTEEMYIHFNDINKSKITLNDATISSLVNGIGREGSEYLKSTGASGGFSAVIPVGSTSISYTVSGETDNYFVGITGGCSDTDGDGTPDYQDLDSDNDGCPDALEGDGDFEYGDLDTDTSLGDTVEKTDATKLGVPTAAGAGQTIGSSQDVDTQSDECDSCNSNSSLFKDTDGDKIGDDCDLDDDNDGILDKEEQPRELIFGGSTTFSNPCGEDNSISFSTEGGATSLASNNMFKFVEAGSGTEVGDTYTFTFNTPEYAFGLLIDGLIFNTVVGNFTILYDDNSIQSNIQFNIDDTLYPGVAGDQLKEVVINGIYGATDHSGTGNTNAEQAYGTIEFLDIDLSKKVKSITFEILAENSSSTTATAGIAPILTCLDKDGDGIPNHLDLDSDNDGCPDALEGDGGFDYDDLEIDTSLGDTIEDDETSSNYGVPTVSGSGQGLGSSQNDLTIADECDSCNKNSTLYADYDKDDVADDCDLDDDNDGILDLVECVPNNVRALSENLQAVGTANVSDLKTNDQLINSNALTYNGNDYDIIVTLNEVLIQSGVLELNDVKGLKMTGVKASEHPYVEYTLQVFEAGTSNLADLKDVYHIFRDIDGASSSHFRELAGFKDSSNPEWVKTGTGLGVYSLPTKFIPDTFTTYTANDVSIGVSSVVHANWLTMLYGENPTDSFVFSLEEITPNSSSNNRSIFHDILVECDTDEDGIPNHLDLDSDGDECPDSLESDILRDYLTDGTLPDGTTSADTTFKDGQVETTTSTGVGANGLDDDLETTADSGTYDTSIFKDGINLYQNAIDDTINIACGAPCLIVNPVLIREVYESNF